MNCRTVEALLPLFVGGDLDASRASIVRNHLPSCERCGALARGLAESRTWLASDRSPFGEEDYAAIRRGVWRRIEANGFSEGAFWPGRLALAAGAAFAALLAALLWLGPNAEPPGAPVRTPLAASPVAVAAAPQPATEPAPASPRPMRAVQGRARAKVEPRSVTAGGIAVKIEFQTANPDVRIIWLVKNGEAAPRPASTGRHQEVS